MPSILTLSEQGLIADTTQKLNKLVSYFLVANISQSSISSIKPISLSSLLAKNYQDPAALARDVETELTLYLRDSFKDVDVQSSVKEVSAGKRSYYQLNLQITATDESGSGSINTTRLVDNDLSKLIDTINEGDGWL